MNRDTVEGNVRKVAGRAREVVGEAIDDPVLAGEGVVDQLAGQAQACYGSAVECARDAADCVVGTVRRHPVATLAVAALAGFVISAVLGRRDAE